MTTQVKPGVEIAIDKLVENLSYSEYLNRELQDVLNVYREGRDFSFAMYDPDARDSEQERIDAIRKGIALMRSNLEMKIFDLNTIEADFADALREAK